MIRYLLALWYSISNSYKLVKMNGLKAIIKSTLSPSADEEACFQEERKMWRKPWQTSSSD